MPKMFVYRVPLHLDETRLRPLSGHTNAEYRRASAFADAYLTIRLNSQGYRAAGSQGSVANQSNTGHIEDSGPISPGADKGWGAKLHNSNLVPAFQGDVNRAVVWGKPNSISVIIVNERRAI